MFPFHSDVQGEEELASSVHSNKPPRLCGEIIYLTVLLLLQLIRLRQQVQQDKLLVLDCGVATNPKYETYKVVVP